MDGANGIFPTPARLGNFGEKKSIFLFGPRATGKSSLLKREFPNILAIDLLDSEMYLNLSAQPSALERYLDSDQPLVIIDEVQRVPDLLNEVHAGRLPWGRAERRISRRTSILICAKKYRPRALSAKFRIFIVSCV